MAQSRETSNGPDWLDIARAMNEFQEANEGVVTIAIASHTLHGPLELMVEAKLWSIERDPAEAKSLASAKQICSASSTQNLTAAVFRLLYAMDFQLGLDAARRMMGE